MPTVLVEDDDATRWITFNRPEKLNALTRDDLRAAAGALAPLPDHVRAVVVTGAGSRAFSAGVHVQEFRDVAPHHARALITDVRALLAAARRAPVPTVCAVNGYCLGGAMELAMACDLRVASTTAVFGMPEINVGIPSVLDAALLQQYVGLSKAKEILLTGDLYAVDDLQPFGFANLVVPPEELRPAAQRLAERVGRQARPAMAAQKRLFETWQNVGLESSIEASVGEFAETFVYPETLERIADYRAGGG